MWVNLKLSKHLILPPQLTSSHSETYKHSIKSIICGDFPGDAVVKNLPANAGDTGSSPGPGRSHMPRSNKAHVPQLLSLRSRAHALQQREATTMRSPRTATKRSPRSPQLEKARVQQRRPSAAKNK